MIIGYFKELLTEWVGTALLIGDVIIFVVSAASNAFTLPIEFYWVVAVLGFIIANVRVYSKGQKKIEQLKNKLSEYELQEANITVKLLESKIVIKSPVLVSGNTRVKNSRSGDGLDDNNVPISHYLHAKLEIENAGYEHGTFIWRLNLEESDLPDFFELYEKTVNGFFTEDSKIKMLYLGPRESYEEWWKLPLRLREEDPRLLAHKLSDPAEYRLTLSYKTKRIGGETPERSVMIEGDFTGYRNLLINKWKARSALGLVDLANGAPLERQIF
jgi:hypothetical protein